MVGGMALSNATSMSASAQDVSAVMAGANPAAAEEPASSSSDDGQASDDTAAAPMDTVDVGSADKQTGDNKTQASTVAPSPQDPEQPLEDNLINWSKLQNNPEDPITSFTLPAGLSDMSEQ